MTNTRRQAVFRVGGAFAAVLLATFVGGGVVGYLEASGQGVSANASVWVMAAVATLIMAGALWVGALWMRSIDEAAREAHKAAWYWGGCAGMCVGGVGVIMAGLPQAASWRLPPVLDGRTDPAAYMAAGAFGMLGLMIIGYTAVWAWWWFARSRG